MFENFVIGVLCIVGRLSNIKGGVDRGTRPERSKLVGKENAWVNQNIREAGLRD